MESSICHHASGSHRVTWWQMTTWPLSILARVETHSHCSCKHTLDTFLAHTALANKTICGLPNVLQMASPRVFTASDRGNHFTAKEIHQWAQAQGIKSPPLETVGISVRSWCGRVKQYPQSWDTGLPPGPLGFFMPLNQNARKSSVHLWWLIPITEKYLSSCYIMEAITVSRTKGIVSGAPSFPCPQQQ